MSESQACRDLEARWANGLSARIGFLCALVKDLRCTRDELTEYAAYIVQARLTGFLSAQMADEAGEWIAEAELCLERIAPCNGEALDMATSPPLRHSSEPRV